LEAADVHWAFSGLELINLETGELIGVSLHPANEDIMLRHYGIGDNKERKHQLWRTETAAALPETAQRRRIPPERRTQEAKGGRERLSEHGRAATAALQALRHANVLTPVESIVVQREPFSAKGARAELFATGTRFSKHRMWHVEVRFTKPVEGPIAIGDGRFLGLGVMAPVRT
jgi:CRISPR-associated protein Csb2